MKTAALAFVALLTLTPVLAVHTLEAQPAPRVSLTLAANELTSLEAVRKAVWVHWFSGDTAALHKVLAPELVAIGGDTPHWQTLAESLAGSVGFKASGGKFVSVAFTNTATHRFGETVVMFSHYAVETERAGKRSTQKGRATEVFVRTGAGWVHTSWHLDSQP